ncbi:hypothetical protein BRADI_2g39935v3 [Brachypodium distachyon]|uniref:Uncharacterized protein n=1 Tax=Brachypodium distachyon TaxID=15368 RepID=A0A2K2DCY3_BRADI|nr:hypothetical protein BRADI_2g39935v3 [Brachypodium distachyon]
MAVSPSISSCRSMMEMASHCCCSCFQHLIWFSSYSLKTGPGSIRAGMHCCRKNSSHLLSCCCCSSATR